MTWSPHNQYLVQKKAGKTTPSPTNKKGATNWRRKTSSSSSDEEAAKEFVSTDNEDSESDNHDNNDDDDIQCMTYTNWYSLDKKGQK